MTQSETRRGRATWTAGLAVAASAGVATAHGLFQVAKAAGVPGPVAWLYPLITDGLALVAYAATARLYSTGRRYAATIVILAAGLSGLAQAVYLAGGITTRAAAPVGLRFGVGYWPAVAAAIAAHLLHLIGTGHDQADVPASGDVEDGQDEPTAADEIPPLSAESNWTLNPSTNSASNPPVQPRPIAARPTPPVQPELPADPYNQPPAVNTDSAVIGRPRAAERARAAAASHRDRTGALPTVTELMRLSDVARGTAGTALKALREQRPPLHLIDNPPPRGTHQ
jgi:hypothetical protein